MIHPVGASLLHSAINRKPVPESLITHGHIITAVFIPPFSLLVGASIRRLAQHRWCNRTSGACRVLPSLGLSALPLGFVALLFSIASVFVSELAVSVRLAGLAVWILYPAVLIAERLRAGPFTAGKLIFRIAR